MRESVGILRASEGPKLIVEVDPGITLVARALIPKAYRVRPQRWPAHVTVVRNEFPQVPIAGLEGREITFHYDPFVRDDGVYWWLDVHSSELVAIRQGLGLPGFSEWARPPDGRDVFHMTIGNTKIL